ncbi:UBA/THIF-type NAD/FAD binding protein [Pseudonocardia dioxanivorans CB1190]|uniref:UBA/THIF-type NAD/FAD binding protein n=1 Tax=Pseudonocardia dioxanivorans (strain ATCC 55486 / DSM 44775 / JCM 13855 / CB1190) TaxID=675635 RepID=F4CXB9_PSEUX|nr:ThiF family adenylyltransferase [Pseudonocardia dioxanivorans]AEA26493.1 UBA/THIF-type NAD/FAD binding protein [Pseudonocardia dioxanivorans CB1190]
MSPRPTSPSPDLQRLLDDGYDVELREGYLLIHHIPYVTAGAAVSFGTLVSTLDLSGGGVTVTPSTHVASWIGEHPCHADGTILQEIAHAGPQELTPTIRVGASFSSKPSEGYVDYHHKMTTYAEMIMAAALKLDPTVTARTYPVRRDPENTGPFLYADTATARAGLGMVTAKITGRKVAVVGVGGTGSWVLDLLARCPVDEIHIFDDDRYLQHNAFRSPGPTPEEELVGGAFKVEVYARRWAGMRTGVVAHPERLGAQHTELLSQMDMVFICVDTGDSRRDVVDLLELAGCDFIDVGMGLLLDEEHAQVLGQLRTTLSTPEIREEARRHMPLVGSADDAVYAQNIQTAELNALNAVLAILRWKRARGVYTDLEHEVSSVYLPDGNTIVNAVPSTSPPANDPTTTGHRSVAEFHEGNDMFAADGTDQHASTDAAGA